MVYPMAMQSNTCCALCMNNYVISVEERLRDYTNAVAITIPFNNLGEEE